MGSLENWMWLMKYLEFEDMSVETSKTEKAKIERLKKKGQNIQEL